MSEVFAREKVGVVEDVDFGNADGKGVGIDDGEAEGEVGLVGVECEMKNFGGPVTSLGCFEDAESFSGSEAVVDFESLPGSGESLALFPIAFVDGNPGVGKGGGSGGEIDSLISSVGEVVGDLEKLIFDRERVAFLGKVDSVGDCGGEYQGKESD